MSRKNPQVSAAEFAALRLVEQRARDFRDATCRAVRALDPRGEVEYDRAASALDGALQALANLRGGK